MIRSSSVVAQLRMKPVDSSTKGTVAGHAVLAYVAILVRSMYAAAALFAVADDSADEVARLEVGSTIATSMW